MKSSTLLYLAAGLAAVSVSMIAANANKPGGASTPAAPADRLERGRYLVTQVGLCSDCHSPRDAQGGFIPGKNLAGSPIGFQPLAPMPWAPMAPPIAGLPAGFTETETVRFLMTGERPQGRPAPLPPMPPFRFSQADAEAVAAYLRSLAKPTP